MIHYKRVMPMLNTIKRFILWDYPRGGWQYDLMVVSILAFIFITPKDKFSDQPNASSIVMLPTDGQDHRFWIGRSLLESIPALDVVITHRPPLFRTKAQRE